MYETGLNIFYNENVIYHPYKKGFSIENFYSLAYFWGVSSKKVSILFGVPGLKMLVKYTLAIVLSFRDWRYMNLFKAVWKCFVDGRKDITKVM